MIPVEYLVVGSVALVASLLTFFSGFGLGTMLTPAFFLFFSAEVAVALTAVVHLLNNLFKLTLIGKHLNWQVWLRFGLPALPAAWLGAQLLQYLAEATPLVTYPLLGTTQQITPVNLAIGLLVILFALQEIIPRWNALQIPAGWLVPGGLLSGFFGGLSGHQGAMRTAFLIRYGLSKEAFVATGTGIACVVDLSRLSVYADKMPTDLLAENGVLLSVAVSTAFLGAWLGRQLLRKVTLAFVQKTVAFLMILLGTGLVLGFLDKT